MSRVFLELCQNQLHIQLPDCAYQMLQMCTMYPEILLLVADCAWGPLLPATRGVFGRCLEQSNLNTVRQHPRVHITDPLTDVARCTAPSVL